MSICRTMNGAILCACLLWPCAAMAADDILIADFEGSDWGAWKAEGDAFGRGPARGALPQQMPVSGYQGKGLVNTYIGGDKATGALTSPPFKIERKFINFLIGGGKYPGETCMNLIIEGKVVRTATGPNDRAGGSERLDWQGWDVAEFIGKTAAIQIIDKRTGRWGHINVDQITQSDNRREVVPAQREMTIEQPYLHLPVKNGGPKCRMRFAAGEETLREFEIELADADPDFWVFSDVSALTGRRITIHVDSLPEGSKGLGTIVQADAVPDAGLRPGVARPPSWRGDAGQVYREKLRPQFHFSSRRGWNNDPNGLVYHAGEYHLYYQHNPYGWKWGNMHWGHAVSADLVHWKELPVAIYPHKFGDWVFSGSAAVDAENTGGFKTGREDVIVAAYTSTGRGECIAYSNDRGRTFADFQGNPVVKHGGRDPKIIWYAPGSAEAKPGKHWVMAVYDQRDASKGIAFYTSPDLKAWEFGSRIEGYFECPEIFELPLECDPCQTRWVVYAASGDYSVGAFDGKTFTPESGKHKFSYGNCFYASQTFNNILHEDGRRIQIAWGRIATPGMPFNQCMLFPVELTLRKTDDGPRLFAEPVREIAFLHAKKHSWRDQIVMPGENLLAGVAGDLFEIRADFEPGDAAEFGLSIRGTPVLYNVKAQEISCKGCKAPLKTEGGRIRMHILVDRTSIEVFANHGRVYMPVGIVHPDDNRSLETVSTGGAAKVKSLEVWELKSAWE